MNAALIFYELMKFVAYSYIGIILYLKLSGQC